ncbi:unnamed protein product [Effrenium voratum]|nr:unnamed protein product [Effrenium voratum]
MLLMPLMLLFFLAELLGETWATLRKLFYGLCAFVALVLSVFSFLAFLLLWLASSPLRSFRRRDGLHPLELVAELPLALCSLIHSRSCAWLLRLLRHLGGGDSAEFAQLRQNSSWFSFQEVAQAEGWKGLALWTTLAGRGPRWQGNLFTCALQLSGDTELRITGGDLTWHLAVEDCSGRLLLQQHSWQGERLRLQGAVTLRLRAEGPGRLPEVQDCQGVLVKPRRAGAIALEELRSRQRVPHLALHWHVFTALMCRGVFPEGLLSTLVGPCSAYGACRAGAELQLAASGAGASEGRLFCTIYSRASLPVRWAELQGGKVVLPVEEDGFWIVRYVPCAESTVPDLDIQLRPSRPSH